MKKLLCFIAVLMVTATVNAQKKVAVVTFYADKEVGLSDVGMEGTQLVAELVDDPSFNLQPLIDQFHEKFFNEYAKKFPFELLPEASVTGNAAYQAYKPQTGTQISDKRFVTVPGYIAINHNYGKDNETAMLNMFKEADGVMFVYLTFQMTKGFGVGGTATTKMQAYTNITLYNKEGKKVFAINENANSKKTGMMVGGLPVMAPEKVLPMCESALDELMKDLDKRLQKIIDKSAKKL